MLHGVNPDGHEELVKHRLEREYLLQIFVVVEIFGNLNICCMGSNQMDTKSQSNIGWEENIKDQLKIKYYTSAEMIMHIRKKRKT